MAEYTDHDNGSDFNLPYPDTAELKSTQSVRATFRLSAKTILALNIVSNQLGVKQKSLFDHLIADTDALEAIAREVRRTRQHRDGRVQKTFVISRKTLSTLQKMADDYQAPRDALVEFSIRRLKPVIEQEKEKLAARKKLAGRIEAALKSQQEILQAGKAQLGESDPIVEQFSGVVERFKSAQESIQAFVKKSEKITQLSSK